MDIINKIKKNVSLARYSTFKIGGPAEFFLSAAGQEEFIEGVKWAKQNNFAVSILGGGSNVLINDKGVKGLVIRFNAKNIKVNNQIIICEAGSQLSSVAVSAYENNLSGFEWSIGIPGTIGGAIRGNAGAFGETIGRTIKSVKAFDLATMSVKEFLNVDCDFKYRESFFKKNYAYIILDAEIKLESSDRKSIKKKMDEFASFRRNKQPSQPSAGSIFKNIEIGDLSNQELIHLAKKENVIKGNKIPAGWVIGLADLKNKSVGGAEISEQHANFIINTGTATAEDVVTLISVIKTKVRDEFSVRLQEEIIYFGF
jgi:UDP-N-acetylmuramate dehydrogenase